MVLKIIQQKLKDFELSALSRWFPSLNDVPFRVQFSHYQYQEQRSSNLRFVFFWLLLWCVVFETLRPGVAMTMIHSLKKKMTMTNRKEVRGCQGWELLTSFSTHTHTKIIITITGVWKGAKEFRVSKSFHEKVAEELITPRFLSKRILDYHFYISKMLFHLISSSGWWICMNLHIFAEAAVYLLFVWELGTYGCFRKWWYPQITHFNRVFHYKPSILGYPYFWKHPYLEKSSWHGHRVVWKSFKHEPPWIAVDESCPDPKIDS